MTNLARVLNVQEISAASPIDVASLSLDSTLRPLPGTLRPLPGVSAMDLPRQGQIEASVGTASNDATLLPVLEEGVPVALPYGYYALSREQIITRCMICVVASVAWGVMVLVGTAAM